MRTTRNGMSGRIGLLVAAVSFFNCLIIPGGESPDNLLKNGGFETTIAVSEKDATAYFMEGWSLGGSVLPATWDVLNTPYKSERFVPGFIEVMVEGADAKEGKNCLRLSTPEGTTFLRSLIVQKFDVPESRTIEWSYWAHGKAHDFAMFYYLTSNGYKTVSSGALPSSPHWSQRSGKILLQDCTAKNCLFALVTYQMSSSHPATTFFDDAVIRTVPFEALPFETAATKAPPQKPEPYVVPLVSRDDYMTPKQWNIGKSCGKDFWHMQRVPSIPVELDRFPKLAKIFNENSALMTFVNEPPSQFPNAPFIVDAPRWGTGAYCDSAGSMYFRGDADKVLSFRPKKTINGVKGYNLDGWRSEAPLPQSILYDFYDETFIESVRVYPAFGNDRQTRFTLECSMDGKSFETIGEKKGEASRGGDTFEVKRKLVFLRLTVQEDSTGQAHIIETEFIGEGDKPLKPCVLSATSEAMPLDEKGIPTKAELFQNLKRKYGDRFLGFIILEFDNCFMMNLIAGKRNDDGSWYGRPGKEKMPIFPFRPYSPQGGQETYDRLRFGFERVMKSFGADAKNGADVTVMLSWLPWEHYACELGSAMACTELPNATWLQPRSRLMFSRSAARQYQKPWMVYMTSSFQGNPGYSKHFNEKKAAGIYKGDYATLPYGAGVASETLVFRYLMLSYMMGCNFYEHEDAYWLGNFGKSYRNFPYDDLASYGRALIRAFESFQKLDNRGVPYTPVAFCLDYMHGLAPGLGPWTHNDSEAWEEGGRAYKMYWQTLDALLPNIPEGFRLTADKGIAFETDNLRMSNSHCGDAFDVLLPNPPGGLLPQENFDAYKAIVLLGNIRFTPALTERLVGFVKNGGTLLLNVMYLGKGIDEKFAGLQLLDKKSEPSRDALDENGKSLGILSADDCQQPAVVQLAEGAKVLVKDEKNQPLFVVFPHGKGRIITCTVPEMLSEQTNLVAKPPTMPKGILIPAAKHAIERLHDEAVPFRIEGDIECLFNKIQDGWLVTLINNRGIYKELFGPVVREDDKTAIVTITPKEAVDVSQAMEILEGNTPVLRKSGTRILSATVAVPPGDVRIVKFFQQKRTP